MGISLRIIANLLKIAFLLPALVHEGIDGIRYKDFWKRINQTSKAAAFAIDVYCNVAYRSFLNAFLIRKGGYHYGEQGETVTSATGKNWTMGTLTIIGEGLAGTLNWIDKDHCWKYIMGDWHYATKPAKVVWWKTFLFLLVFVALFSCYTYIAWILLTLSAKFIVWLNQ